MSNFGHERERKLKRELESRGWLVVRAAGSLGVADLIALKAGHTPMILEVKATARGPFSGFPPADRAEFLEAVALSGCVGFLVWWPKRSKPIWLAPDEWPS